MAFKAEVTQSSVCLFLPALLGPTSTAHQRTKPTPNNLAIRHCFITAGIRALFVQISIDPYAHLSNNPEQNHGYERPGTQG